MMMMMTRLNSEGCTELSNSRIMKVKLCYDGGDECLVAPLSASTNKSIK